ncbi:long-chain fatty acid CoA synthetase [Hamiltosporidium tvaerminnensis]|uniref:Long-chain fatty acid CoA synthetase n=1 Tax=Hamiltosporidium tvaerminnensis TaxID=1176355 RepID=A0A4V2JVS0_9MICR|nr:medium-chain fatty acid-CoA ligase faa2 [Hamiltosporidium tvaerminnensis]TBU05222.1 long-chain fatty acid CoA synthetase [Hamiltosporidium tvaerminnensis]
MAYQNKKEICEMVEKDGIFQHKNYIGDRYKTKEGFSTVLELMEYNSKKYPTKEFLGKIIENEIVWSTFETVYSEAKKISCFLKSFVPQKSIIGIYSINRPEWLITEQALYLANCINCPLYSTFGIESLKHILDETEMNICFCSGEKVQELFGNVLGNYGAKITHIISYDDLPDSFVKKMELSKIKLYFYNEILNNPNIIDVDVNRNFPKTEDIATICYTSGTTNKPKGVIQTHKNFISMITGYDVAVTTKTVFDINEESVYMSYLPLAHAMEHIFTFFMLYSRARIAFYRGNVKLLLEDINIIKPTFFVGVPRVFDVFKEKIEAKIAEKGFIVRWLFKKGLKSKILRAKKGIYTHRIFDTLIFNKIKMSFGGQFKGILSGSAPLNPDALDFFQAVFSCPVVEGFGQTEACAGNIIKSLNCFEESVVGVPFPVNQIKLDSTTVENNVFNDNRGEILIKGLNTTPGYFKIEDCSGLYTKDGWLRTGDIGKIENGYFKIIGRIKEIFKLSLGEYIVPEKVESLLKGGIIDDILITGNCMRNFVVALVVCKNELISDFEVMTKILNLANKKFKEGYLVKYEIPQKVFVIKNDFSFYGDFITPTGKKKRYLIETHFKSEISELLK